MPVASVKSPRAIRLGATVFALGVFLVSWWHWWTFQYATFDIAFYQQALWLALRGEWWVSLLNVPLLGNHAEPLVFLLAPLFAVWPHAMLLVGVQTLALASMPFTGYRLARQSGHESQPAIAFGLSLLLLPASASVGLHEFHPETFAAPLLLLLIEARLAGRLGRFWLWFAALLACKENLALLLATFCAVFAVLDWRRGHPSQLRWNLLPLGAAVGWLGFCAGVLSPWLNAGNVDYLQLYAHLGTSGGEIVRNFLFEPQRAAGALWHALTHGDLLWSLLLPLLLLPLLRPHWLLIATPLLLQHLLSVRFIEWRLGAHYPAPFIPLFWVAAVEAAARLRSARRLAWGVLAATAAANLFCGALPELASEIPTLSARLEERQWKAQLLATIPPDASVTAAHPYLSHLANRRQLHSLHHVIKGLKTLSTEPHQPTPTDFVIVDFADPSTFSTVAGFYHPASARGAPHPLASSDRLLHEFLRPHRWEVHAQLGLALYRRGEPLAPFLPDTPPVRFDTQTTLLNLQIPQKQGRTLRFRFAWRFGADRQRFPWLLLVLSDGRQLFPLLKGACAPEAGAGDYFEDWLAPVPENVPAGHYEMFALFYDHQSAAWAGQLPPGDPRHVLRQIQVGRYDLPP